MVKRGRRSAAASHLDPRVLDGQSRPSGSCRAASASETGQSGQNSAGDGSGAIEGTRLCEIGQVVRVTLEFLNEDILKTKGNREV